MSNATTLSSLAMLKVNIDNDGDYLEYLIPYVLQVLVESPPEVVSDISIAAQLRSLCGLEIPRRTVHIVLKRLARKGFLEKSKGVYTVVKNLPITDTSAERTDAERHITAINKALISFALQSAMREITEEQATNCFIAFLSQFSIPCLKYYLRGTALPNVNGHDDWQVILVSQFIGEIISNTELFGAFMKLVQGHMLANALLCPDLKFVSDSYKDVIFYFDTPLLIQLLGLDGEQEKQAIKEVVGLVQNLEGQIAYFSHTFDELINCIKTSANFIDSPYGRGAIVDEARKSGITKSDLLLIAHNASEVLAEVNICGVDSPSYDESTHQFEIAEEVFASVLDDELNYHNPRAKEYDIKSVRSIYVLRRKHVPFALEKSRAVLVTNNEAFAKAAYEYGKTYEQSREVSTVITEFSLANIAWLKAPQGAPSLPAKEVLAFAYATIRPSNEFWSKVLIEAEKLEIAGKISVRDHQVLRSSHLAQEELMKLTLGEESALTAESITKTLSRVSAEIRKEESERLEQSEIKRIELQAELDKQIAQTGAIKQQVYWRCDRRAKWEVKVLSSLIWIVQILIAVFGVMIFKNVTIGGSIILIMAVLNGVMRLASTRWDIKPLKAGPAFKEWRMSRLLKREYEALSIKD
jgi:predicted transcriptional regulator